MLPDFRVRQRDYLLEISRALTQVLDLDKLLGRILNISIEMLAGQAGLIALHSEAGGWPVRVSYGLSPAFLHFLEPYLSRITDTDDPEQAQIQDLNRTLSELTRAVTMGQLTGVVLPLVTRQKVLGFIFIFRGYADFTVNDRALLNSFATQAAIAVQNAQLYSQISREKQRMDALLDCAADGILILTPRLTVERVNDSFLRMLDRTREQVLNASHNDLIQWARPPEGLMLEDAVAGGWPLTPNANLYVEGDLNRSGKLVLPVGILYAPLLSAEGTLLNVFVTLRDISRFRQAEELKSTFISVISHELKTPVALIKGYAGTLRREDANWDSSITRESLAVIEEEADRLAGLIENLLDVSRLQADRFQLKKSDVNLPDLSKRVAERMQTQTERHHIVSGFPAGFPAIYADETRIQQVLSNLVSNAIKYAPGGEIRIAGSERPDLVIICVSDEGPGIAPEDIPHIFDRFYRSNNAAKHSKGVGLGLFLAKSIVEAHNGRIWVDAGSTRGARICFSLPKQVQL